MSSEHIVDMLDIVSLSPLWLFGFT